LSRWKAWLHELLNVHGVDVRKTETHTAEKLLSEFRTFEVGIATENLKKYTFPGINQILLELIQAEDETLRSQIHELIYSVWCKVELPWL
jgi:hypothetical protein